jgi:hypothetical protein
MGTSSVAQTVTFFLNASLMVNVFLSVGRDSDKNAR